MTSNHSNVNVDTKKEEIKQNDNIKFSKLRKLYHIYQLLYCKGHIQITSNHSNINVEIEKTIE